MYHCDHSFAQKLLHGAKAGHASIRDDQLGLQNTQNYVVFPINGYKGCRLIYTNYTLSTFP